MLRRKVGGSIQTEYLGILKNLDYDKSGVLTILSTTCRKGGFVFK